MQKFLALTTLVAAAHAAELLTDADKILANANGPADGIDDERDTSGDGMGATSDRDYYKRGYYANDSSFGTNATDAEIRPLCSVEGAEGQVDSQGPSDQCCRTYDYVGFEGNHRDWCLFAAYNRATWTSTPEKYYDLDQLGWHNDISSWKCGNKVMIEMCKHDKDDSTYDAKTDIKATHCSSGHQLNSDMGSDSQKMDSLWIRPQGTPTDEEVCTATLYEEAGCEGPSFVIESNVLTKPTEFSLLTQTQQWQGSWKHYDSAYDQLLTKGTIKSVMFKGIDGGARCVVEMFQDGNFQSDSMTLKSLPSAGEACHPVPFIKPITDPIAHGRWAGNNLADYNANDVSGVRSVHIRQEYFP